MKSLKPSSVLLCIFLISLFIRLCLISKGPYHVDCLNLAVKSAEFLQTALLPNLTGPGYPLTIILGSLFILLSKIFGIQDPVMSVNLMSVVLSTLGVVVFYYLLLKLFDPLTAFFGALLLSFNPIYLSVSLYGMSHAPSVLFLLWTFFYIVKFKETAALKHAAFAGLSYGLALACRLQDALLTGPAVLLFFLFPLKPWISPAKNNIKAFLLFCLTAFGAAVLFYLPYLLGETRSAYLSQWNTYQNLSLHQNFIPWAFHFNSRFLLETFTLLGLAVFLAGLLILGQKNFWLAVTLVAWILVPFIFMGRLNTTIARFMTFFMPAYIMGIGFMLAYLFRFQRVFKIFSILFFAIIFFIPLNQILPSLIIRHSHAYTAQYAQWVKSVTEPNARIITCDDSGFMDYYAQRLTVGRPFVLDQVALEELTSFQESVENFIEKDIPVYITSTGLYSYDKDHQFSQFVKDHFQLELIGARPYEIWHTDVFRQTIVSNSLYRLMPKNFMAQ